MSFSVLQITDVHLLEEPAGRLLGVRTQASLEAVLDVALADRQPDAILATGDIAHEPSVDVYLRFAATLANRSAAPLMCVPGNHDLDQPMRDAALSGETLRLGAWALIGLDSHLDDQVGAELSADTRRALVDDVQLAVDAGAEHVLVATHHPFVSVDSPWLDAHRVMDAESLLDLLSESTRAVVFGHAHQAIDQRYRDVALLGTPATCFQFAPRSTTFGLDTTPPGWRWLTLHEDGRVTTEVQRIDASLVDTPDPSKIQRHAG